MAKTNHWTEAALTRVLPIWKGQVGYACELMETTIIALTVKFSGIVKILERTDLGNAQNVELNARQKAKAGHKADIESTLEKLTEAVSGRGDGQSEECINALKNSMEALTSDYEKTIDFINQENKEIKSQVEQLLVDLQFQDRVSQILRQVVQAQSELQNVIAENQDVEHIEFDVEKWVEGLRESYAMEDQHQIHEGSTQSESKQRDEITFF